LFAFPVGLQGLTWSGKHLHKDGVPVMGLRAPQVYDAGNLDDVREIAWDLVDLGGQKSFLSWWNSALHDQLLAYDYDNCRKYFLILFPLPRG
jgi:hypothetical protein